MEFIPKTNFTQGLVDKKIENVVEIIKIKMC